MIAIRLKEMGTKNRQMWRIVVAESHVARNGRLIDELGSYNPLVEPPAVVLKRERYDAWIKKGAKPSRTVAAIVANMEKAKK
jgi:small subunit ribosomal protein S16